MKKIWSSFALLISALVAPQSALANSAIVGYQSEVYAAHKNPFYSLSYGHDIFNYTAVNILITSLKDADSEKSALSPELTALFADFEYEFTQDLGVKVDAGQIIVPLGLYEYQRVFPSTITPRSMNNSFYVNKISSGYFNYSNPGAIGALRFYDFTLFYAYYTPASFSYTLSGLSIPPATVTGIMNRLNDPTIYGRLLSDLLMSGTPITSTGVDAGLNTLFTPPAVMNYKVEKQSQYAGLKYAGSSFVLSLEGVLNSNKIEARSPVYYKDLLLQGGVEFTPIKRLFIDSEALYYTNRLSYGKDVGASVGVAYDLSPVTLGLSLIKTKGTNSQSLDYTFGIGYAVNKNLSGRLAYRIVKAAYTTQTDSTSKAYCDSVCVGLNKSAKDAANNNGFDPNTITQPESPEGLSAVPTFTLVQDNVMEEKIDAKGIEFLIIYSFE